MSNVRQLFNEEETECLMYRTKYSFYYSDKAYDCLRVPEYDYKTGSIELKKLKAIIILEEEGDYISYRLLYADKYNLTVIRKTPNANLMFWDVPRASVSSADEYFRGLLESPSQHLAFICELPDEETINLFHSGDAEKIKECAMLLLTLRYMESPITRPYEYAKSIEMKPKKFSTAAKIAIDLAAPRVSVRRLDMNVYRKRYAQEIIKAINDCIL